MKPPRHSSKSPKIALVETFVLQGIRSNQFPPGSALPPIRQLAETVGVSYVTVWKALRSLCERGTLSSIPGQLIEVAQASPTVPASSEPSSSSGSTDPYRDIAPRRRRHWRSIVEQIEEDVYSGRYEQGVDLPPMKRLGKVYHTTYRTLAKALAALSRKGVIKPRGIGYFVPILTSAKPNAAICFLVESTYLERRDLGMQSGHDYLGPLELQGSRASVRILLAPCVYSDDQLVPRNPAAVFPKSTSTGPTILGYVLVMNHPDPSRRILASCARTGKPLSVLDESALSWDPPRGMRRLLRVYPVASSRLPGAAMGRYLLGLGHRRIAYFSVYEAFPWSVARLQGIEETYRAAGHAKGVVRFTLESDVWWFEAQTLSRAERRTDDARGTGEDTVGGPFEGTQARRILDEMDRSYSQTTSIERHLEAMFLAAANDTGITAWVAENDEIATLAHSFLQYRRVAIPDRVSLVSFDNSPRAASGRITSYDFNVPSIMSSAIRHILEDTHQSRREASVRVDIEGSIVERESSGWASGWRIR